LKNLLLATALATGGIVIGGAGIASAAIQSDYTLVPPGDLFPPETYALSTSSNEYRGDGAWGDYTAPNGTSPFYVINGAIEANQRVFYWTGSLTAGQSYSFSFLAVDNYPVAAPVLQLSDNGVLVGNAGTLTGPYGSAYPSGVGPWQTYTLSFTAASTGLATLGLVDTNLAYSGNDFSIATVPEPSTWAMMLLGFAGLGFAGYRTSRKAVSIAS
jgi:hypothetical protein